ncbi:SMP-30/gluconolactonase/LRE family protein [Bradyrhizobium diazoefficiens]|uniref:ABC transporter permease n=1 Tax=Bradyrhizobium diazoefficiens TaxID=1355477 RepID=A0A810CGG0_9BRAD|nr:ABC transporter permease [Bradyrhizobium diazoefficiens]BCF04223.1 ABC transporter permease [Bradyrhizobium diazoefficiens]BCF12905.1 ABC transporter permease [Bradyrhizobium diazoefficiens]BCF65248.1 ABC transporter permease [Bradyrhizobium diazoefficiens]
MRDTLTSLRYRYWPDHLLGEILSKRWTETAIPVILLLIVGLALSRSIDNFLSPASLADTARQAGEIGFIALGLALVVIVGGIDLSVGSIFALTDFCALYLLDVLGWPVPAVVAATLLCGTLLGAVNGVLIGYLRLRAFITTLITLIIYRSAYDLLIQRYSNAIASAFPDIPSWDFIGGGSIFGIPTVALVYIVIAIFGHIFMTRLRPGWHITAIGGSRRSAYNSGIPVRRTIALCYVASGVLTSIGALFFASRLGTVGGDIGVGLEVIVLTATVLGGITLGGGKGSVAKSAVGVLIVLLITNGLTTMNARGGVNRMALAGILLVAAMVDIRWQKNRTRIISKVYVAPTYHALPPPPPTEIGQGGPFEQNDKLRDVELIGLGRIEAPEDVILDRHDNLYAGSRHGDIIRFLAPDYQKMEVFAHIGGQPLGMAFDREDNLYICIGGMGLYRIKPDGTVEKATDETNRSMRSVNDDSRLRLADDLDITDDGLIFFSEATVRYEMDEWPIDGLEARGNGRIICYDQDRRDTDGIARPQISQRHLRGQRRPVDPVRRDLWLLDQALLVRRTEEGRGRGGDGQPPRLPRQHQPRLRRQLLAGAGRHAQPFARPRLEDARLPAPHGQACAGRRVAVPEHQHRLRCQVQRAGQDPRIVLGPARRKPSDDHLDARASRLPLSRRHRQQPDRPLQARQRRSRLRPV